MNPVAVVRRVWHGKDDTFLWRGVMVWCPGCDMLHEFRVRDEDGSEPREGPMWDWDGDLEMPTFSPSLMVHNSVHLCGQSVIHYTICPDPGSCGSSAHYLSEDGPAHVQSCDKRGNCHSFLRAGTWEFLGDSAHPLAGQKVPMVPVPDWIVRDAEDRTDPNGD